LSLGVLAFSFACPPELQHRREPSALLRSFNAGGKTLSPAKFLEGLSAKIREEFAWGSMEFKTLPPGKWSIARPSSQSSSCHVSRADSEFHPGLAGRSTRKPLEFD